MKPLLVELQRKQATADDISRNQSSELRTLRESHGGLESRLAEYVFFFFFCLSF